MKLAPGSRINAVGKAGEQCIVGGIIHAGCDSILERSCSEILAGLFQDLRTWEQYTGGRARPGRHLPCRRAQLQDAACEPGNTEQRGHSARCSAGESGLVLIPIKKETKS